jgi:hypothetical protein
VYEVAGKQSNSRYPTAIAAPPYTSTTAAGSLRLPRRGSAASRGVSNTGVDDAVRHRIGIVLEHRLGNLILRLTYGGVRWLGSDCRHRLKTDPLLPGGFHTEHADPPPGTER